MGERIAYKEGAKRDGYYACFYVNDEGGNSTSKVFSAAAGIWNDGGGYTTNSWVMGGPFSLKVTPISGCTFSSDSSSSITYASSRTELYMQAYKSAIWFRIYANSSGKIGFTITMTCKALWYINAESGDSSASWTSPTYTMTTACTAPTSISASTAIVPGNSDQSLTVSWSGAKGGTGNSISSYTAYCRIGSAPAEPEASWHFIAKNLSTSTSSYTFTIPSTSTTQKGGMYLDLSHNRGQKIYFGVIAVGSVSGFNAPIKTVAGATINTLPNPPTITANPTSGNTRSYSTSITFSTPSDTDTSQTRTVYYANSSSGSKTKITTGTSLTVSPSGTDTSKSLYFWSYDGLEYSSTYTTKTFTFGTDPTAPTLSANVSSYSVYNTSGQPTTYYKGLTNVRVTVNTFGTLTPYLEYKTTSASSYSSKALSAITVSAAGTVTVQDIDVDAILYGISSSYRTQDMNWRVYCKFVASGVTKNSPTTSTYTIGATPSAIRAQYNRIDSDSNYTYTTAGHMSRTARILIPKDETLTLTKSNITCKINNSAISASDFTATISNQTSYYRIDITLNNYPSSAAAIVFSLKFTSSGGNSRTYTINYTGTKRPTNNSFGALTLISGNPVQAFETGSLQFSLSKQLSSVSLSTLLSEYECNPATSGNHLGFYVYNKSKNASMSFNVSDAEISGDNIIGSISYTSLFDFGNDILTLLGITKTTGYHGSYGTYCAFVMKNGYGDVLSTTIPSSYNINFNFDKDPTNIETGTIQYSIDGGGTYQNLGTTPLRIGMRLKIPVSFKLYTYEEVVVRLKLAQGSSSAQFILNTETIPAGSAIYANSRTAPSSNTVNIYYDISTAITSSGNWAWTPVISVTRNNSRKDVSGDGETNAATQQKPPATIVLNSCNFIDETDDKITFDFVYTISDSGLPPNEGTYTISLVNTSNRTYVYTPTDQSQYRTGELVARSIEVNKTEVGDVNMVQIRLTSTIDGISMDYDSAAIFVYRQAPLVSYRKNVIGINSSKPEEQNGGTAVVVVQSASGKQEVVMLGDRQSGSGSESVMLLIDIPEGRIELKKKNGSTYDTTHKYIDFINGEIHGFVLK